MFCKALCPFFHTVWGVNQKKSDKGMCAKMESIRLYPDMAKFTIKAFYEKDAEISAAVQKSCRNPSI